MCIDLDFRCFVRSIYSGHGHSITVNGESWVPSGRDQVVHAFLITASQSFLPSILDVLQSEQCEENWIVCSLSKLIPKINTRLERSQFLKMGKGLLLMLDP